MIIVEKNKKEKYVSGYFKLLLLIIGTVFLTLLLRSWYISGTEYGLNYSVIRETLVWEITPSELYNYVRESEEAVIYIGYNDKKSKNLEREFNKLIRSERLEERITYLNLSRETDPGKIIKDINKFYNLKLSSHPAIIIFNAGSPKASLNGRNINVEKIKIFLSENDIRGE